MNCLEKQQQLASCIKKDVPAFQKIMVQCNDIMIKYQTCLQSNLEKQSVCLPLLKDIRECASGCVDMHSTSMNELK
ncbi:hypothetical protein BN1211_0033 [Cyberlindnera jadinii]|uniref:IMS import disulfide relay-system CHCH-CHCH-like Cx9C domain-containing protein n=1 Tax=Cyberlindnera jadinii (strain ATCC 18201 / CBS 1600 / BCRC 20928 / JCM 3617 / NBRC 0987 / NRRL Y-1542) TaxID=983966 RepID=A0A0H5CA92_CYBJN|nr:hypothetical protein BN1211_0033 [Cyberlindnera jadinii]